MNMKNRVRIIQTFWSGGADPLTKSYGWTHPEYNLMSWALSCCSLREHYDQVELYSDQRGYEVLIGKLHLPYTSVHVVLNDNLCLPQHWAYAKIKTYSLQTEPFLHVDGDIYISHPFDKELFQANLVVQNEEIGTAYYRNMLDAILRIPDVWFPDYAREVLDDELLPSYNMGVFGGWDLEAVQDYCRESSDFLSRNGLNEPDNAASHVDCNVFFEQMLFAIYARKMGKTVAKVIKQPVADTGYTRSGFCDVARFHEKKFFHILGGHKQVKRIYQRLADVLLSLYPVYYRRVMELFGQPQYIIAYRWGSSYGRFLSEKTQEWQMMSCGFLMGMEKETSKGVLAFHRSGAEREKLKISLPGNFTLFSAGTEPDEEKKYLKMRFRCEANFPLDKIAVCSSMLYPGFQEFPLIDEDECLISCLQRHGGAVFIEELLDDAVCRHGCQDAQAVRRVRGYAMGEIACMVNARVLTVCDSSHF